MPVPTIILAVGSPPGRSLRGLVRASGPGAFELLDSIVHTPGLRSPEGSVSVPPTPRVRIRGIARARLRIPAPGIAALVIIMPGPGSATGDDTFELLLPGNPLLLEQVIDEMIAIDSRACRAGPGEFSARAFFNGRLTLDQAEGISELIRASSDAELDAARRLASGSLGARAAAWTTRVAELCASLEAGIDFTDEEDVVAITPRVLADATGEVLRELDCELGVSARGATSAADVVAIPAVGVASPAISAALPPGSDALSAVGSAASGRSSRSQAWLPRVALVGPPNAGKSTLFNALVGASRTVESSVAGTTRDAIENEIAVAAGQRVILVDLPGLDAPLECAGLRVRDPLEARLHVAALRALAEADLVLRCEPIDGAAALPRQIESAIEGTATLRVITKCDELGASAHKGVTTSARTGAGLAELRAAIANATASSAQALAGTSALLPRHRAALMTAQEHLRAAQASAERERVPGRWRTPEETAASLRLALDALGQITGATTPDDVLGLVFARFCIGK